MTPAVDTEVAATVLAALNTARKDLETATPRIGRVETQAWAAFAWHQHSFQKLVTKDLAPKFGEHAAKAAASAINDVVNRTAASAVAEGMDLQLARGWDPGVAWQRVLAGYGLDSRRMHAYLGAAMSGDPKTATAVVPPSVRASLKRTLVTYAVEVARDAVAAAKGCATQTISKDYDPNQLRDEGGQWTTQAAGAARVKPRRPARVAEREREDTGLQEALDNVAEEAPPDRYATATRSREATRNRYDAATRNRYDAATKDRYASATKQRDAALRVDRDAKKRSQQGRRLIAVIVPEATPTPEEFEVVEGTIAENEGSGRGGFYLDQAKLGYWGDYNMQGGENVESRINFATVMGYTAEDRDQGYEVRDYAEPVELQHARSAWDMAEPDVIVENDDWTDLMKSAKPLWNQVWDNPVELANTLSQFDLKRIADIAGKPETNTTKIKASIAQEFDTFTEKGEFKSPLLSALADHVVWRNPGKLGDNGAEFYSKLRDLDLEDSFSEDPPSVLSFPSGVHENEDTANMLGQYRVQAVAYRSALSEMETGTPPGIVAVREVIMQPDRV